MICLTVDLDSRAINTTGEDLDKIISKLDCNADEVALLKSWMEDQAEKVRKTSD